MATYTPTSHLTTHTSSSSSGSYVTVFQASATNPTYLSGVLSSSGGSGHNCNILITPTAGSTVTGSRSYRFGGDAVIVVIYNNQTVMSITGSSSIYSFQISPTVVGVLGTLGASQTTGLALNKELIPPGYYVQMIANSGTSTVAWNLIQEEIY